MADVSVQSFPVITAHAGPGGQNQLPLFDHNWYWMAFTPRTERNLLLCLCEQMATGWWRVLLLFRGSGWGSGPPEALYPPGKLGDRSQIFWWGFQAFVLHITLTSCQGAGEDAVNLRHLLDESYFLCSRTVRLKTECSRCYLWFRSHPV